MRPSFAIALFAASSACAAPEPDAPVGYAYPDPSAAPPLRGPGGPATSFSEGALWAECAALDGRSDSGDGHYDHDFHNLVMPYRGHLVMPWAAEWGWGGLSFFDVSDPCSPTLVGSGYEGSMRETHAIAFLHLPEGDPHAGDWAVVNHNKGVLIWDITDPEAPVGAGVVELPDVFWPDAYARVVLSVFWQHPWLYVAAADNGLFVIDTSDPTAPALVTQVPLDAGLRAGGVFALGDRLLISPAEQTRAALYDISVPDDPQPFPGGLFEIVDGDGYAKEAYHGNQVGDYAIFARKEDGGGVIVYDISDPSAPRFLGDVATGHGSGGYVFWDEGYALLGNSDAGYAFDARDLSAIVEVGAVSLTGDLDTVVPYGNVLVVSVDDDAETDRATVIAPWQAAPDSTGPEVLAIRPGEGAQGVATTARIGVGFDEIIEPSTAFPGSIRVFAEDGSAVEGWCTAQEATVTFTPKAPLSPGATYRVEVLAGGVTDINGNAVQATVTATFETAGG